MKLLWAANSFLCTGPQFCYFLCIIVLIRCWWKGVNKEIKHHNVLNSVTYFMFCSSALSTLTQKKSSRSHMQAMCRWFWARLGVVSWQSAGPDVTAVLPALDGNKRLLQEMDEKGEKEAEHLTIVLTAQRTKRSQ